MPHAKIKTHQAKHTLEQLHAELGGKILDNRAEAKRLAQCMKHVEAVLKLLDPAYSRSQSSRWLSVSFTPVLNVLADTPALPRRVQNGAVCGCVTTGNTEPLHEFAG